MASEVAKRIKGIGWTQEEIALELGVSKQSVAKVSANDGSAKMTERVLELISAHEEGVASAAEPLAAGHLRALIGAF